MGRSLAPLTGFGRAEVVFVHFGEDGTIDSTVGCAFIHGEFEADATTIIVTSLEVAWEPNCPAAVIDGSEDAVELLSGPIQASGSGDIVTLSHAGFALEVAVR